MKNNLVYFFLHLFFSVFLLPVGNTSVFGQSTVNDLKSEKSVTSKTVEHKNRARTIKVSGEFKSYTHSELGMQVNGRVKSVYVNTGDQVTPGQLLLELEDDYLQIEKRRVQAELKMSKALLIEAERDFNRKKELAARKSVSPAILERSEARLAQSKAGEELAEVAVELVVQKMKDSKLLSPINGVVQERLIDIGEKIGDHSVTFILVEIDPLRLQFRVPEQYLASIEIGDPISVTVAPYPDEVFTGEVSVVGKVIDPRSRTLLVEAHFNNELHRLSPGLFATVTLTPSQRGAYAKTR